MEEYLGDVAAIRHLTLSAMELTIRLVAPSSISFAPGQHMFLLMGKTKYILPLAFPPLEHNSEVVVLMPIPAQGELKDFAAKIKVGDQLELEGPAGDFVIADPNRDILGVAGGVGIAPFAAIVPNLLASGFSNKFKLLFEVAAEEDVFYFERFNALATRYPNFKFVPMVMRPHAHWPGEVGTADTYIEVSAELLQGYAPYICGSEKFVQNCVDQWRKSVPKGDKPRTCTLNFAG